MQLIYPDIPRHFVQSVHILRHDPSQTVRLFQFIEEAVHRVGPGLRVKHVLSVIVIKGFRLKIKEAFAQNNLRG